MEQNDEKPEKIRPPPDEMHNGHDPQRDRPPRECKKEKRSHRENALSSATKDFGPSHIESRRPLQHGDSVISFYFLTSGGGGVTCVGKLGFPPAGVAAVVPPTRLSFTDCGSLSAFASSTLTCHICVVDNVLTKPGMPVIRIPPETFQYVSPAGSSVTPVPSKSFGGFGNIPFAIAVCGVSGT